MLHIALQAGELNSNLRKYYMNSETRKKIIVAADDFGISKVANKKIMELVESKKIDRVAIMTDGNISQEEINKLLHSGVKLDVHLNITEKFNGPRKLEEGIIKRATLFLVRYIGGQVSASIAEKDWENQIKKFKEIIGKYPDGINSHHHIHYYPGYFKASVELARKYQINFMRCGKKGFLGNLNGVKQILSAFRRKDASYLIKNNIDSSDYLASFDWIKKIDEFLNNLPKETVEITFHPEREEEYKFIKENF